MLRHVSKNFLKLSNVQHINKLEMSLCTVAVCQFTANENKERNLKIVEELITNAAKANAKIIFLPEACDYIETSFIKSKAVAETLNGNLMTKYKTIAKSLSIWLSIGGFHELVEKENEEPKLYNAHVLIDEMGQIRTVYRKLHLFDVAIPEKNIYLKESDVTVKGTEIPDPVETPAGSLSLSICYDLRFPELSIINRKKGAHILTFPSAFTNTTGQMHWEVLLKARAIENQCYVIAAAQYGRHNNKRTSYGQSMIVDPWGNIIAECPKFIEGVGTNESIAVGAIDPNIIKQIREEMPVLKHRRNDLYELKLVDNHLTEINDNEIYKFADKSIPGSTVFYQTKHSFAFTNIRCVVPGHVLVSSLRYAPRLNDLTSEEIADLFQTAVKVQRVIETVNMATSSTVCVQDGKDAGQTVPHVHIHVMPRLLGDFVNNDEIYAELAKHDRDDNTDPVRNIQEMSAEAQLLRQYFVS